MKNINLVCGTRYSSEEFFSKTMLGRCLHYYCRLYRINMMIFPNGNSSLPVIFNKAIDIYKDSDSVIVFMHDDIGFMSFYWPEVLMESLAKFDVVGLVGNHRRLPRQPAWAFKDDSFAWDDAENFCGAIGHGKEFPSYISYFGQSMDHFNRECKLIDGALIAISSETLKRSGLRFDERFNHHLYDVDLCRQAEELGLTIGVTPISALHESGGTFGTLDWRAGYQTYLEKWGE